VRARAARVHVSGLERRGKIDQLGESLSRGFACYYNLVLWGKGRRWGRGRFPISLSLERDAAILERDHNVPVDSPTTTDSFSIHMPDNSPHRQVARSLLGGSPLTALVARIANKEGYLSDKNPCVSYSCGISSAGEYF